MSTVPNFSTITELEDGQGTFWLTSNVAFETLAAKISNLLTVTITSADVTLTAAQCQNAGFIRVIGALTGNRNLIVENSAKFYPVSHEGTGNHTVTVKRASGTGVAIDQGAVAVVYCDGTNVVPVTAAFGASGGFYDIDFGKDGLPASGAVLKTFIFPRAVRLPQNLVNSVAILGVAPTLAQQITLKKGGTTIGTINFAIGATTPTYTFAADVDFAAGDILTAFAPSPQDATLANLAVTLAGIRL